MLPGWDPHPVLPSPSELGALAPLSQEELCWLCRSWRVSVSGSRLFPFLSCRRFLVRVPGAHFHQQQLLLQPQGAARHARGGAGRLDAPGLVALTPTRWGAAPWSITSGHPLPPPSRGARGGLVLLILPPNGHRARGWHRMSCGMDPGCTR